MTVSAYWWTAKWYLVNVSVLEACGTGTRGGFSTSIGLEWSRVVLETRPLSDWSSAPSRTTCASLLTSATTLSDSSPVSITRVFIYKPLSGALRSILRWRFHSFIMLMYYLWLKTASQYINTDLNIYLVAGNTFDVFPVLTTWLY